MGDIYNFVNRTKIVEQNFIMSQVERSFIAANFNSPDNPKF